MIPKSEISQCVEHMIKSKIGETFVNEKILEEYCVKIYEIDPYFYEHYEKKKRKDDENVDNYVLFRVDIYFSEYFLAIEVDEKGHTDRDLIFEKQKARSIRKKLDCNFIHLSKENYEAD